MYITIDGVIGKKKTIYLDFPIYLRPAEIAVLSVFSDNVQYEIPKQLTVDLGVGNAKKLQGVYSGRELIELLEGKF